MDSFEKAQKNTPEIAQGRIFYVWLANRID